MGIIRSKKAILTLVTDKKVVCTCDESRGPRLAARRHASKLIRLALVDYSLCTFFPYDPVADHGTNTVARDGGVVATKMTRCSLTRVMDGEVPCG
jgi:hypothetical protein